MRNVRTSSYFLSVSICSLHVYFFIITLLLDTILQTLRYSSYFDGCLSKVVTAIHSFNKDPDGCWGYSAKKDPTPTIMVIEHAF